MSVLRNVTDGRIQPGTTSSRRDNEPVHVAPATDRWLVHTPACEVASVCCALPNSWQCSVCHSPLPLTFPPPAVGIVPHFLITCRNSWPGYSRVCLPHQGWVTLVSVCRLEAIPSPLSTTCSTHTHTHTHTQTHRHTHTSLINIKILVPPTSSIHEVSYP